MDEGCYCMGIKDGFFIIYLVDQLCDEFEGVNDFDYVRCERFV